MSLTGLPFAILTTIQKSTSTGYDLTKILSDRNLWKASHQQVYRDCNKLQLMGYLHCVVQKQKGKPDRKVYHITDKGLAALNSTISESTYKADVLRLPSMIHLEAGSQAYFDSAITMLVATIESLTNSIEQTNDRRIKLRLQLERSIRQAELKFAQESMSCNVVEA